MTQKRLRPKIKFTRLIKINSEGNRHSPASIIANQVNSDSLPIALDGGWCGLGEHTDLRQVLEQINAALCELNKRQEEREAEYKLKLGQLQTEYSQGQQQLQAERTTLEKMRDIAVSQTQPTITESNNPAPPNSPVPPHASNPAPPHIDPTPAPPPPTGNGSRPSTAGMTEAVRSILEDSSGTYFPATKIRDLLVARGFDPQCPNFSVILHNTLRRLSANRLTGVVRRKQAGKTVWGVKQ